MNRFYEKKKNYRFTKVYGFTAAGAVAVIGFLLYEKHKKDPLYTSWTTSSDQRTKWDDNWDKRQPEARVKPLKESATDDDKKKYQEKLAHVPKVTRHIIMIRHGQYLSEEKTDLNRKLTELGKEQAHLTGKRLAEMNYPWTKLIVSSMIRAQETADIIHKYLPDIPRENTNILQEGAPIPPEPPSSSWKPEVVFYRDGARIEAAFRQYFHRADASQSTDSYEIMICHANVIRYFVCRALQFPPEAWLRISLNHASITWVYIRPNGRVGIKTMGESGFMPVEKLSAM